MLAYDGVNLPMFPPSHKNTAFSQLKTHRRIFVYEFCTISDETYRLHTCVRKTCIACKFRETFDGVLEGVDGCREIFLKDGCWRGKRRKIFSLLVFGNVNEYHRGCPKKQTKNTNTDKHKEINI